MENVAYLAPEGETAAVQFFLKEQYDFTLETHVITEDNIGDVIRELERKNVDLIIARLAQYQMLLRCGTSIPILRAETCPQDMMLNLLKAQEKLENSSDLIGVITYSDQTDAEAFLFFSKLLGLNVDIRYISDSFAIQQTLKSLVSANCRIIVAGRTVLQHIKDCPVPTQQLVASELSLRKTFNEASKICSVLNLVKIKTKEQSLIFQYMPNAIVITDASGMIKAFNPVAQNLLALHSGDKGTFLGSFLHQDLETELRETLQSDGELFGKLVEINDTVYSMSISPAVVDNITKGFLFAIQEYKQLKSTETNMRRQLHQKGLVARYTFDDILTRSGVMYEAKRLARQYALHDSTVLLTGETGTGKELFAHSIHNASLRKENPFVTVNCAAIPENLIESELFGYTEGAFTGANRKGKMGLFELAHTGTVFLDEISELTLPSQQRFLRVLQEGNIMRIGDDKIIPVDVRIIVATNKNLRELVRQQKFREDLYYRLDVLSLDIPPLRQRIPDMPFLFHKFLLEYGEKYGKHILLYESELSIVSNYTWPGNIRQMRNFCEKLVVSSQHTILAEHIINQLNSACRSHEFEKQNEDNIHAITQSQSKTENFIDPFSLASRMAALQATPQKTEESIIREALRRNRGNRGLTAKELGISPSTLWRKMKRLHIFEEY